MVAVDVEEERTDGQGGALVLNWNGYSVKDGSHEMLGYAELLAGDFAVLFSYIPFSTRPLTI